jgi:hypothetical protein
MCVVWLRWPWIIDVKVSYRVRCLGFELCTPCQLRVGTCQGDMNDQMTILKAEDHCYTQHRFDPAS